MRDKCPYQAPHFCVEHLVKANRKMRLELSANQSGTLNECKRKRSMNLVRGTKIELGLF